MERDTLPRDHGMLFVHQEARPWGFWMLNTRIPLDVVWMDADGRVVDIRTMQPEPDVPQNKLTLYTPRGDALYALEANAGLAARVGLTIGNTVRLHLGAAAEPPAAPECS